MRAAWDAAASAVMALMLAIPLWGVKIAVICIFAALAVWALGMPREYIYRGADDNAAWRDLRFWAAGVIALEIAPYLFF